MNSMIQPISGLVPGAAQAPAAASGVEASSQVQPPENKAPVRSSKPVMDEYIPEGKREPSGRYWLGRDEDGQPKIFFDDPAQAADRPEMPDGPSDAPAPAQKAAGDKAERCTGNTDQVDREIEKLKKQREELERQINSETDEGKRKELEQKLAQVEQELNQKDNDGYRRQHTVFS